MADRILRIRANDRDADLCTITSDGVTTDIATPTEALLVIERLADQIRGAHTEAQKWTPGGMAARIKALEGECQDLREQLESAIRDYEMVVESR